MRCGPSWEYVRRVGIEVHVDQSPGGFCKAILLAQGDSEELAFIATVDTCVVLGRFAVALGEALVSLHVDTHLVRAHEDPVLVHALMCHVDLAILQPLLDFVSLEVECVRVHSTESLPHAVSAKRAVTRVVGVHECCGHHADVIGVHNVPHLLPHGEQGLLVVQLAVERLKTWDGFSGRMRAEVPPSGGRLVVVDDYLALPLATNAVAVSALEAIGDAVGRRMVVATDQGRTVSLLTENGEETQNCLPTSHYVVPDPGNFRFCLAFAACNSNTAGVPDTFLRTGFGESRIRICRSNAFLG